MKGVQQKEVEKKGGDPMNQNIDEMVTGDIAMSPIVIQGKGEGGNGPVRRSGMERIRRQGLLDLIPGELGKLDTGIVRNVVPIVKMPGAIQGVAVNGEYKQEEDKKGNDVFSARGKIRCFIMNV